MKRFICLIILGILVSCDSSNTSVGDRGPDKPPFKMYKQPRIYLSSRDQFINFKEINRKSIILNLSDRIIFSDKKEKDTQRSLKPLKSFKEGEELKLKIYSFCAYKRPEQKEGLTADRAFQEIGSRFYHWSFPVFDLIPKEILLNGLDKIFNCGFVFAFKDDQGIFNHYNMAQQFVQPFFSKARSNRLSLIRETETGHYLPVNSVIASNNIHKILLLNNTSAPISSYHLFCKGLKVMTFPGFKTGVGPVFLGLMDHYRGEKLPKAVLQCRFFSENNNKITGMTNFFELDFNDLKYEKNTINLKEMLESVVVRKGFMRQYKNGARVSLNSYFYFDILNEKESSIQSYPDIEIKVKTQCLNKKLLGKSKVLSLEYSFPFRRKFPVMAVTPKLMFLMDQSSDIHDLWFQFLKSYKKRVYRKNIMEEIMKRRRLYASHCMYRIGLQDRQGADNKWEYIDRSYFIDWTKGSYRVGHDSIDIFVLVDKRGVRESHYLIKGLWEMNNYVSNRQQVNTMEKPFFDLNDIYSNRAGYLKLDFFDMADEPFFQLEGPKLDRISLECRGERDKSGKARSMEFFLPYSIQNNPILVKTVFSHLKVRQYIRDEKVALCRIMLYEDQILRYFSREMTVTAY